MSLINEHYVGYRPELWDEQTGISIVLTTPPNPDAIPQPYIGEIMDQEPAFQSFITPEQIKIIDRDDLLEQLKAGKVSVMFETADGETSTMICTLNPELIPLEHAPKTKPTQRIVEVVSAPNPEALAIPKATDPNLIKVYAIDRNGWRSFRFERLLAAFTH